jgi:hypothetical protein
MNKTLIRFWRRNIKGNIQSMEWNETQTKEWMIKLITIRPDLAEVLLIVIKHDYPQYLNYIQKILLLQ